METKQRTVLESMDGQIVTQQISAYEEKAKEAAKTIETMKVRKFEDIMDIADALLPLKEMAKEVTDRAKQIAVPSQEIAEIVKSLKKIVEGLSETEKVGKEKVLTYYNSQWKQNKAPDNKVNGLKGNITIKETFSVNIVDADSIPRELCSPDSEKIEHFLKSGQKIKGAELIPNYTVAVAKN